MSCFCFCSSRLYCFGVISKYNPDVLDCGSLSFVSNVIYHLSRQLSATLSPGWVIRIETGTEIIFIRSALWTDKYLAECFPENISLCMASTHSSCVISPVIADTSQLATPHHSVTLIWNRKYSVKCKIITTYVPKTVLNMFVCLHLCSAWDTLTFVLNYTEEPMICNVVAHTKMTCVA